MTDTHDSNAVQYKVHDVPPWYLCILLGFQHYISMFIATLTVPFLLAPKLCMLDDNVGKSQMIGTLFVASGIVTLMQTTIGVRLPIVQAGTFALLIPTLAFFNLPEWDCPANLVTAEDVNKTQHELGDNVTLILSGTPEHKEKWMGRLRVVQGSLMVAALFQLALGFTGAVGALLRFIGPLSICPTVSLLGLSLFRATAVYGSKQWWICLATIALIIIFSQYMGHLNIPCCFYKKQGGFQTKGYPLLKMFPVILSMVMMWLLSFILTVTNVFPDVKGAPGYEARTDIRASVIKDSPWFYFPYPCQWGTPVVNLSLICGLLAGLIATTVESVGDYHACADLCDAPTPPTHAINRGIFIEAVGSFIDAILGTGNGTTSTSINVGVVGITKVGSRRVVQVSAAFMIVLGVFNKFGALFITIPDPVIGGAFFILFGMITAVGISNLQHVDLGLSRNIFIIGIAFLFGLSMPEYIKSNPDAINTGVQLIDSVAQVLLSTHMFVGGLIGFVLDNTIPGTAKERGIEHWQKLRDQSVQSVESGSQSEESKHDQLMQRLTYDLPEVLIPWVSRFPLNKYLPICPTFGKKRRCDVDIKLSEESAAILPADRMGDSKVLEVNECKDDGVNGISSI